MKRLLLSAVFLFAATALFAQEGAMYDFFSDEPSDTAVVFAPGVVSKSNELESDLVISPLGNELFYVVGEWPRTKIMHSEKIGQRWTQPDTAAFSKGCFTTEPTFSADGQWIYYSSSKGKANVLDYNLWRVRKSADGWTNAESVLNIGADSIWEFHPTMTRNKELYFCLWNSKTKKGEIYKAQCSPKGCTDAEKVDLHISTDYGISDPYIDFDGSYMIYSTNMPGGLGDFDQYISYRLPDGGWSAPKDIGAPYNTTGSDFDMDISPDGKYIISYSKDGILLQKNTLTNK